MTPVDVIRYIVCRVHSKRNDLFDHLWQYGIHLSVFFNAVLHNIQVVWLVEIRRSLLWWVFLWETWEWNKLWGCHSDLSNLPCASFLSVCLCILYLYVPVSVALSVFFSISIQLSLSFPVHLFSLSLSLSHNTHSLGMTLNDLVVVSTRKQCYNVLARRTLS